MTQGPNFELYDKVNVYGNIINNTIHNLYMASTRLVRMGCRFEATILAQCDLRH